MDQDRAAQVWEQLQAIKAALAMEDYEKGRGWKTESIEVLTAYGQEIRQEQFRAGVEKFIEWSYVAFYPGPNKNPHFQAGFMEAVHEVGKLAHRLLTEQEKKV